MKIFPETFCISFVKIYENNLHRHYFCSIIIIQKAVKSTRTDPEFYQNKVSDAYIFCLIYGTGSDQATSITSARIDKGMDPLR